MNLGGGDSNDGSGNGEEESPTLANLVEKVNQRRSSRSQPSTDGDTQEGGFEFGSTSERTEETGPDDPERPIGSFGADPKTEAIIEVLGDARNILLLGPLLCPADYDLCTKLTMGLTEDPDNLLLVTMTQSPDERLNVVRGYLDELPPRTAILNIGDATRSGTRETIKTAEDGEITIESIADSSDLMRIGISISKFLSDWADDGGNSVLCFHSLTALLQFVDEPKVVFRFIHVLQGQIRGTGATAHYHMDRGAHDDQTISTFRPLFDEVLTYTEEGKLSVEH